VAIRCRAGAGDFINLQTNAPFKAYLFKFAEVQIPAIYHSFIMEFLGENN
jgi:hypothetical protein